MTVGELIEHLQSFPVEADVVIDVINLPGLGEVFGCFPDNVAPDAGDGVVIVATAP